MRKERLNMKPFLSHQLDHNQELMRSDSIWAVIKRSGYTGRIPIHSLDLCSMQW